MKLSYYSLARPAGVMRDASLFTAEIVEAVEREGVFRGTCPCCDLRVVVRAPDRSMTAGDEHFLLHGAPAR